MRLQRHSVSIKDRAVSGIDVQRLSNDRCPKIHDSNRCCHFLRNFGQLSLDGGHEEAARCLRCLFRLFPEHHSNGDSPFLRQSNTAFVFSGKRPGGSDHKTSIARCDQKGLPFAERLFAGGIIPVIQKRDRMREPRRSALIQIGQSQLQALKIKGVRLLPIPFEPIRKSCQFFLLG